MFEMGLNYHTLCKTLLWISSRIIVQLTSYIKYFTQFQPLSSLPRRCSKGFVTHLILTQWTDSRRKLILLMRTLHYQLYVIAGNLSFLKVKNLQLTACWCSQLYGTVPDTVICRCQFRTIFWQQTSYAENYIDKQFFYFFSGFSPQNKRWLCES